MVLWMKQQWHLMVVQCCGGRLSVRVCVIGEAWMSWPLQESLKVVLVLRPFLAVAQRVHADGWLK